MDSNAALQGSRSLVRRLSNLSITGEIYDDGGGISRRGSGGRAGSMPYEEMNYDYEEPRPHVPGETDDVEDELVAAETSGTLGTFMGVFLPCIMSIIGVVIFLKLGFSVGQVGFFGTILLFAYASLMVFFTIMSISAISTNGKIKGGGAYYLISRSLGPEFGGAIGVVFYLANTIGTTFYLTAFSQAAQETFGNLFPKIFSSDHARSDIIWWGILALVAITIVCLVGAGLFAKMTLIIFALLYGSIICGLVCFWVMPEKDIDGDGKNDFVKPSLQVFWENKWHEEWSPIDAKKPDGPKWEWGLVFGILFPAVTGIMAGANMSGDLKNPGKSIPRGTILAFFSALFTYFLYVVSIAFTVRQSYLQTKASEFIVADVCVSKYIIFVGVSASTLSSALSSLIGASRVIQALSKDDLFPLIGIFGWGFGKSNEPRLGVLLSALISCGALFMGDLDTISPLITNFFLITYATTNFACMVMSLSGAPNFRPQFGYFNWKTSFCGFIMCTATMFYTATKMAALSVIFLVLIFLFIHYFSPPKQWGDISQALIYHQVRKFLLRMDYRKQHIKYWRPQILLLCSNPRESIHLIDVVNSLKKGGLYIIGSVLPGEYMETRGFFGRLRDGWETFLRGHRVKAFFEVIVAPNLSLGVQNLVMSSGLGALKPNTVIFGFPEASTKGEMSDEKNLVSPRGSMEMPSGVTGGLNGNTLNAALLDNPRDQAEGLELPEVFDEFTHKVETPDKVTFVQMMNHALAYEKNVLVARHFHKLNRNLLIEMNKGVLKKVSKTLKLKRRSQFVDVWIDVGILADDKKSDLSSCLLCLQLSYILHQTDIWEHYTTLRIIGICEDPGQVPIEYQKIRSLLDETRVTARKLVVSLSGSDLMSYKEASAKLEQAGALADTRARSGSQVTPVYSKLGVVDRCRVMNELIVKHSTQTSLSFLCLQAPPSNNSAAVEKYMEELRILSNGLPPCFLVHGVHDTISVEA